MSRITKAQKVQRATALGLAEALGLLPNRNNPDYVAGQKVWDRTGLVCGITTGSNRYCRLEGCNGLRIGVLWPDKHRTYPCTKGMEYIGSDSHETGQFKII